MYSRWAERHRRGVEVDGGEGKDNNIALGIRSVEVVSSDEGSGYGCLRFACGGDQWVKFGDDGYLFPFIFVFVTHLYLYVYMYISSVLANILLLFPSFLFNFFARILCL